MPKTTRASQVPCSVLPRPVATESSTPVRVIAEDLLWLVGLEAAKSDLRFAWRANGSSSLACLCGLRSSPSYTEVISWGHGCGEPEFPGVYARVASGLATGLLRRESLLRAKDWIHKALAGDVPTPAPSSEVDFHGALAALGCASETFRPHVGCDLWPMHRGRRAQADRKRWSGTEDGCVHSPGYPANYGMREKCRIAVDLSAAAPIRVDLFATEEPYDHLEVNCKAYAGKRLAKKGGEVSFCPSVFLEPRHGPHGITPNSDPQLHVDQG